MDLAWREGTGGRWVADLTPLARVAFERCGGAARRDGLTLQGGLVRWDLAEAPPEPRRSVRLRAWERLTHEEIALRTERAAARRPGDADALATVQADLAALLAEARWAFRSKGHIAQGFAEAVALTPGQHRFAAALLSEARDVVVAVDRRLAEPAGQADLAAARDPDHRADLLEACRILTALDSDRAHDRNGAGWSAIASPAGHRLAGREELTALEGGHARALVYAHRAQVPVELRERLGF